MCKKNLPHRPDRHQLDEGPERNGQKENRIESQGRTLDTLCRKTAHPGQKKPAEQHKGDGNFIAVKLGQKLPDRKELGHNRGDARPDDR